jgi:hypothetical protein
MHSVMNRLFEQPILAANDVIERFNVTHRTAMATLRKLEDLLILTEVTGKQRNQRYVASQILETLQ